MESYVTTLNTKREGEFGGRTGSSPSRLSSDIFKELRTREQMDSPELLAFARFAQNLSNVQHLLQGEGYHAAACRIRFLGDSEASLARLWQIAIKSDQGYQSLVQSPPQGWKTLDGRVVRQGEQGYITLVPRNDDVN